MTHASTLAGIAGELSPAALVDFRGVLDQHMSEIDELRDEIAQHHEAWRSLLIALESDRQASSSGARACWTSGERDRFKMLADRASGYSAEIDRVRMFRDAANGAEFHLTDRPAR